MEKSEEKLVPTPPSKKKKNKGWSQTSSSPTEHLQHQQIIPQCSQKENQSVQESQKNCLEYEAKSLSEMSKIYHIEMGLELGSGFASIVYLGENIHTQEIVCVKVIDYMALGSEEARKILNREIKYLNQFNSPHIVKLIDVYESISFCYLIMEYCSGGDLFRFILKSQVLHPLFIRKIIQQICLGLIQLKKKSLIHRDLKSQNIFLTKNFEAKIGDLGFCVTENEKNIIDNVGSPIYMSPEVLQGGPHSYESDVYGLGVIWYELFHKMSPWTAKTETELLQNKLKMKIQFPSLDISEADRTFIEKCLMIDPKERCSVEQVLDYCNIVNEKQMEVLRALKEKQDECLLEKPSVSE